jgi:hypothetical protein
MAIERKIDVDRVAASFVSVFPTLDLFEQRLAALRSATL